MLEKTTMTREIWILNIFGEKVPLEAIGLVLKSIAIPMIILCAFILGQIVQSENTKWLATFKGIKNPATGEFLGCKPMLNETSTTLTYYWDCKNITRETNGLAANATKTS